MYNASHTNVTWTRQPMAHRCLLQKEFKKKKKLEITKISLNFTDNNFNVFASNHLCGTYWFQQNVANDIECECGKKTTQLHTQICGFLSILLINTVKCFSWQIYSKDLMVCVHIEENRNCFFFIIFPEIFCIWSLIHNRMDLHFLFSIELLVKPR